MFNIFRKRNTVSAAKGDMLGPDYSSVDSITAAKDLVKSGKLFRLQLLPSSMGGIDNDNNVVYVPEFVLAIKDGIDNNVIIPLVRDGKVS